MPENQNFSYFPGGIEMLQNTEKDRNRLWIKLK